MFKRLHLQFTVMSTLITSFIVILMTCFLLYISESSLAKNEYWSFISNVNSINSYLRAQTVLTTEWMAETENNDNLILYIEDNGEPIQYGTLTASEYSNELIKKAEITAKNIYGLNIHDADTSKIVLKQEVFKFSDQNREYYASVSFIPKNEGFLGAIAVYSLDSYNKNIINQRLLYIGIDAAAIIFLWFFSYSFTMRIIKPVEENRKKQVEFIALASHELRSPLTVITSSMSAMKKSDEKQSARFSDIIDSEVKRMSRLVNDMLSLAGADSSSWSLQLQDIDMSTLILNSFEAFQPIAKNKNIRLTVNLPEDSFPVIRCDRQRMEQVITILLDNAMSYTPSGGSVCLSLEQRAHKIMVSVADNGIGISDENKKHIFDRFYRVDTAHKSKDHFGLGLCIAYEIVRLHRGTLSVSDTFGGGATFVVELYL